MNLIYTVIYFSGTHKYTIQLVAPSQNYALYKFLNTYDVPVGNIVKIFLSELR